MSSTGHRAAHGVKAGHRQDIDALRAVAVSLVVVFHAYPNLFPQGFIGVDIFFVISGFLITSIIREDLEQARFSFFLFYARRCRRILPALLTVLAAVWVCGRAWLAPDEFVRLGKHLWAAASFISNEVQWNESGYFDVESASKPLLHLWSLAVEEQFYVIWPVLLFGAHKLGRSGGDRIAVVLLGATSLGLTFVLADSPAYVFFGFPTRAWELTLGCALALWTTGTQKRTNPRRDDLLSGVGCLLLVAAVLFLRDEVIEAKAWALLLPTCGATLLIWSGPAAVCNRALTRPALVQLGLVSYPLYLWHWPILSFLRITALTPRTATEINLAVAAACVLATLTKLLIEDPIRTRLELGFSRPWRARSTVAGSVLCLGVVGAAGWATQQGLVFGEKQASGASWSGHGAPVFRAGRCFLGDPSKTYRDFSAECMPAPKAAGLDVLVWGDSYGATFFSSLDSAVRASGGTLAALASSRCPPVLDVEVPVRVNCRATNEFVRQYIEQHHVTTVVLAANWVFSYFQSATSPSLTAIDHTVDTLFDLGVKNVVVAGQLPMWRHRLSVALMKSYIMRGLAPPQDSNQWILPDAFTTDAMLSQHFAGGRAKYVSLLDVACPRRTCPLFVPSQNADHVLWTFDNGHPTFEATVRYVEQMGSIIVPRRD